MNLKESFRYHNYLNQMMNQTSGYLGINNNVTRTVQVHQRKKANPDAEDEKLDATAERTLGDYKVDEIVRFFQALVNEKVRLCHAVETAKRGYKPACFDAEMEANKIRQDAARTLRRMAAIKNTEALINGRDYKFNANGDQVPYIYEIKSVTTIDFDRNLVRNLAKGFTDEANKISEMLDHAMLDIEVVIDPVFNMTESFEESVESFLSAETA